MLCLLLKIVPHPTSMGTTFKLCRGPQRHIKDEIIVSNYFFVCLFFFFPKQQVCVGDTGIGTLGVDKKNAKPSSSHHLTPFVGIYYL